MLKELSDYDNLGTPQYFWELFHILKKSDQVWTTKEIRKYFFNRIIDGRSIFDGCLFFAKFTKIITITNDKKVILDTSFLKFLKSKWYLNGKLIERLFQELKNDEAFHEIFCSQNISYDIIYHSIQINNSAFHFKYANFKQLLIDFKFLLLHPDKQVNKFIINSKYKKIFDKTILPEIKKRKIGIDELKKSLEQQQTYGEEAEKFVLTYEHQRLENQKNIDWVAEYWTNAGYDIASYNNLTSEKQNRFIEVKSYSGSLSFFWSRNEIEVARLKKEKYFLYLVDRSQTCSENYIPMIIQNPYQSILKNNKWDKRIEKYFISKQGE